MFAQQPTARSGPSSGPRPSNEDESDADSDDGMPMAVCDMGLSDYMAVKDSEVSVAKNSKKGEQQGLNSWRNRKGGGSGERVCSWPVCLCVSWCCVPLQAVTDGPRTNQTHAHCWAVC